MRYNPWLTKIDKHGDQISNPLEKKILMMKRVWKIKIHTSIIVILLIFSLHPMLTNWNCKNLILFL